MPHPREAAPGNDAGRKQREARHRKRMENAWHQNKNPFDTADWFDQLLFTFFTPLMERGYERELTPIGTLTFENAVSITQATY